MQTYWKFLKTNHRRRSSSWSPAAKTDVPGRRGGSGTEKKFLECGSTPFSPRRRSKESSRQIAELEISLDTRYSCDFDALYFDLRQQWW
jgi:hypothetical protein